MGTIYKRGPQRTPKNGKAYVASLAPDAEGRRQSKSFATKREARLWMLKQEAEREYGVSVGCDVDANSDGLTLAAALREYERVKRPALEDITWGSAEGPAVHYWLGHEFAMRRIDKLYRDEVVAWIRESKREGVSAHTVRRRVGVLRRAIQMVCERKRLTIANPASGHRIKSDPPTRRRPTPDERDALLDEARKYGKRIYYICLWAEQSGMREGEIARMEHRHIVTDGDTPVLKVPKTKTVPRQFFMWSQLYQLYREILQELDLPKGNRYVFGGIRRDSITQAFTRIRERAGVSREVTFHSWRYEANSWMADAGIPKDLRMEILGHVDEHVNRDYTQHAAKASELVDQASRNRQSEIATRRLRRPIKKQRLL